MSYKKRKKKEKKYIKKINKNSFSHIVLPYPAICPQCDPLYLSFDRPNCPLYHHKDKSLTIFPFTRATTLPPFYLFPHHTYYSLATPAFIIHSTGSPSLLSDPLPNFSKQHNLSLRGEVFCFHIAVVHSWVLSPNLWGSFFFSLLIMVICVVWWLVLWFWEGVHF